MSITNHIIKPDETLNIQSGLNINAVYGLDKDDKYVAEGRVIYMNSTSPKIQIVQTYENNVFVFKVTHAYPAMRFMKVDAFYSDDEHTPTWHYSDFMPITTVVQNSVKSTAFSFFKFTFYDINKNAISHPKMNIVPNTNGYIANSESPLNLQSAFSKGKTSGVSYVTKSKRLLIRHPNNKGTLIYYYVNDEPRTLFVADAQFRHLNIECWTRDSSYDYSEMFNHTSPWNNTQYIYNSGPQFINGNSSTHNVRDIGRDNLPAVTDEQLYQRFGKSITQETATPVTANHLTDLLNNSPMKNYARSIEWWPGGLSIPTMYDALMLYVEGDYIDWFDPTLPNYPNNALGKYTNSYRWFNHNQVWTCQEYHSSYAWYVHQYGFLEASSKTGNRCVVPVASLPEEYNINFNV